MTKEKFTKGPWEWDEGALMAGNNSTVVMADYNYDIGDFSVETSSPDASLIAAAPDLYEALNDIISNMFQPTIEQIERALDALAKARGEK